MSKTQALIDLAFAAVDWHDELCRNRVGQILPSKFVDAVAAFRKALDELAERDMILFALDRAGAPREDGVEYPPRLPPYEVTPLAPNVYEVRMNGRVFLCEYAASGWRITQRR